MSTRIEVVIDELLLYGFSPGDGHAIGEALVGELERLVRAGNTDSFTTIGNVPLVRASNVSLSTGARPEKVGAKLAHSIYSSVTPMSKQQGPK